LFWVVGSSWWTKLIEQVLQFHFGIDVSHKAMRMTSLELTHGVEQGKCLVWRTLARAGKDRCASEFL
jgi:hypothetical protein